MTLVSERISRRALLKGGGAAAAGLALPGAVLAWAKSDHALSSHLRRSSYERLIGQPFRLQGAPHQLHLAAVRNLNPAQAGSENAFALVFRARPGAAPLDDAVPALYHPRLGTFRLLLSPGKASPAGQPYGAIINRLHG